MIKKHVEETVLISLTNILKLAGTKVLIVRLTDKLIKNMTPLNVI